jgi:hypothetical protein
MERSSELQIKSDGQQLLIKHLTKQLEECNKELRELRENNDNNNDNYNDNYYDNEYYNNYNNNMLLCGTNIFSLFRYITGIQCI